MKEEDKGMRWFVDMLDLGSSLERFAKSEAQVVASYVSEPILAHIWILMYCIPNFRSLSVTQTPLDVYLLRSHALPLPCLHSPTISFLTHLSPLAYLTLLRTSTSSPTQTNDNLFDIPLSLLRTRLSEHPRLLGAVVATLTLSPVSDPQVYPDSLPMLASRPSFPLVPETPVIDHVFPRITGLNPVSLKNEANPSETFGKYSWILDFTEGGKHPCVVMSQSRIRDIELLVNPLSAINHMDVMSMMPYSTGSWIDRLVRLPFVMQECCKLF